ncbi:MAG TPA: helix-turn-helix domain-containing protein, partial [Acidimicrobiales bacterium]|nr:helix-turn-helix domain-containing protein [Acidimicrobiales bacterium]
MDATPDQVRTRADLGRELTALRVGRGISLRQLARGTGAPLATLGDYFSGRHLPGPAQLELYRSILAACGVTDPAEGDAWIEALRRARLSSDGRLPKSVAPYPGLRPFGEDDHERFFGRAAATGDVLDRLRGLAAEPGPSRGMLLLVGPSGSGKSSLLAAGVAPAVRAGALDTPGVRWECTLVRDPARLAAVAPVAAPDGGGFTVRRLVIVDQLEDVLALPPGSGARQAALAYLADPDPATVVVAAVRADFVPAATAEPALLP